jgi:hypothetical protein
LNNYSSSEVSSLFNFAELKLKENALKIEKESQKKKSNYVKQIIVNIQKDVGAIMENNHDLNSLKVILLS